MIKMKSGRSSGSAFTPIAFPLLPTVACRIDVTSTWVKVGYTASGIAPDLHRTSLLILQQIFQITGETKLAANV
jgi:hypothetical protein